MPTGFTFPHIPIYARDPASKPVALNGALEGHVLVKNENNYLPLKKPKVLSIFGYDAPAPPALDVPLPGEGFGKWQSGYESQYPYDIVFGGAPTTPPQIAPNGTLFTGGM